MMMDNDVRELMTECCERLMSVYPFPADSTVDTRLAYTIGLAVGVLLEGIKAHDEDRPVRWTLP